MKLDVRIEDAGPNWCASVSDNAIHGTVVATGATRKAAFAKLRSAIKFHLDGLREDGEDVPAYTEFELCELVEA
jgi:predicted RNase H-like HicB family nuclease